MRSARIKRSSKGRRPHIELLETRDIPSGVQPSSVEQLFLEMLNDARADPASYGREIGINLSSTPPTAPLAFDPLLVEVARTYSQDMNRLGFFSHQSPDGTNPGIRLTRAGYAWTGYGESLAGGTQFPGPAEALRGLIRDDGVADLGHRRHLLAVDQAFASLSQVGIGIVQAGNGPLTNYYTIETASTFESRPYLTGVVYDDRNLNQRYDIGEGLGGVTIDVPGIGAVTTYASGGYSLAAVPGTWTVTASGQGLLKPIVEVVTVGSQNVRVNFLPGTDAQIDKLYETILGRTAGQGEIALWRSTYQRPGGAAATALAIEQSEEARTRLVRSWYATYLGRQAAKGEETGWIRALVNGAREQEVLAGILGSAEYFQMAGRNSSGANLDSRFVQSLYQSLLGRTADIAEVNGWTAALARIGREGVVGGFLQSEEFRSRLVASYYTGILGRPAAPPRAELLLWINSPLGWTAMRAGFESSEEFRS